MVIGGDIFLKRALINQRMLNEKLKQPKSLNLDWSQDF